ncbi:protein FAR1-related sequence 11 [Tanacetum coccineum]
MICGSDLLILSDYAPSMPPLFLLPLSWRATIRRLCDDGDMLIGCKEDVVVTKFADNQQPDKMDIEFDCSTPAFCSNEKEKKCLFISSLSDKAGVITPTLGAPIHVLLTFDAAVEALKDLSIQYRVFQSIYNYWKEQRQRWQETVLRRLQGILGALFGMCKELRTTAQAYLNVQKVTKTKLENVNRVFEIVKTQLACPCSSVVAPDCKFSTVDADSLDTMVVLRMNEMLMYPKVDSSEVTYVAVKKEVNDVRGVSLQVASGGSHNEKESVVGFLEAWKIPGVGPIAIKDQRCQDKVEEENGVRSSDDGVENESEKDDVDKILYVIVLDLDLNKPPKEEDDDNAIEKLLDETLDNEPFIGQTFSTFEEAYIFYKNYARQHGFSVRKDRSDLRNNQVRRRDIMCHRAGKKPLKVIDPSKDKRNKESKKYHNHDFLSPEEMPFLPINRIITPEDEYQILFYKEAGLNVRQIIRVMELQKQCGDVVVFDTTYKVNRYDMPCELFVGINNHGNTVLFGCALLRNEKTCTFKWLMKQTFVTIMKKSPKTIITDQDPWMSEDDTVEDFDITGLLILDLSVDEIRQGESQDKMLATLRPVSLNTKSPLVEQAFNILTPFAFKKFQEEFCDDTVFEDTSLPETLMNDQPNLVDDIAEEDDVLCPPKSATKGRKRKGREKGGKELANKKRKEIVVQKKIRKEINVAWAKKLDTPDLHAPIKKISMSC